MGRYGDNFITDSVGGDEADSERILGSASLAFEESCITP
jgi:hypothetical protein